MSAALQIIQETKAHCSKCNQDIVIGMLVNCPIDQWIAYTKKMTCPHCGAKAKYILI